MIQFASETRQRQVKDAMAVVVLDDAQIPDGVVRSVSVDVMHNLSAHVADECCRNRPVYKDAVSSFFRVAYEHALIPLDRVRRNHLARLNAVTRSSTPHTAEIAHIIVRKPRHREPSFSTHVASIDIGDASS